MAKEQATKTVRKSKVKYFPDQFEDEGVLYVFRKHPVVMRKGLIWGIVRLARRTDLHIVPDVHTQ